MVDRAIIWVCDHWGLWWALCLNSVRWSVRGYFTYAWEDAQ